ncbi:UDP-galactose transporter 1 [Lecanosticta acicola]|uniref:UDP-galactose transporter 1 n=1 Tax=Lecanosticta acicola TaxID=111012 RepID=A0AAI9EAD3_9PEZI|nr:UDP-galactose transporter 1 [Lecanosticta acicola]
MLDSNDRPTSTHLPEGQRVYSMDSAERSSASDEAVELLDQEEKDLEGQTTPASQHAARHSPQQSTPAEYSTSTRNKFTFLGLYFIFNLSVTLSNKGLLATISFPWLLTFCHTFATSIGCTVLLAAGQLKLSRLSGKENLVLIAFSFLFTLNIAISNVSLAQVSVPFHQVMRSTCPVVTILIYRLVYSRTYSTPTYLSMIPLIIGVGLATFGDYYFTLVGFLLTLLGVCLASIKTVATNRLMTGSLKLSAMEVLFRMSPLAAIQCLLYAIGSGELGKLQAAIGEGVFTPHLIMAVIGNASMAFALNLVSFQTNKVAGALTVSVCGNVKQCLTILLGILLFHVRISLLNGIGMFIAVAGAAYYSKVELDRKKAAAT